MQMSGLVLPERIALLNGLMHLDQFVQSIFQVFSLYDTVDDSVFHQEFRPLEPLRQLLAYGLFYNPGAGKSHQRARLPQNDVSQHGETGRNPSGSGIGQHGYIEQARVGVTLQGRRRLGHLHQGNHPFLHPGPAGAGEDDQRKPSGGGAFNGSGQFFPDHVSHASHHKSGITDS